MQTLPTPSQQAEESIAAFYDDLAVEYDDMTGFEKRWAQEEPFFKTLVDRYAITSALDAGSGTGYHSLLLARLGVTVTAVDLSPRMLKRLQQHAAEMHLTLEAVESSFEELPRKVRTKYDAVFSMGNTLPHLLSSGELERTLAAFAHLLKPGGMFFAQTLNYDRILAQRQRIQSVKEHDATTFVRFYDFENEFVRFNILRLTRGTAGITHQLNSVRLRPVMMDELTIVMHKVGFGSVETFGGVSMEKFRPGESHDLVVRATLAS